MARDLPPPPAMRDLPPPPAQGSGILQSIGETANDAATQALSVFSPLDTVRAGALALGWRRNGQASPDEPFQKTWRDAMEHLRGERSDAWKRSPNASVVGAVAPVMAAALSGAPVAPLSAGATTAPGALPAAVRAAAGIGDAALANTVMTAGANTDKPPGEFLDTAGAAATSPWNVLGAVPGLASESKGTFIPGPVSAKAASAAVQDFVRRRYLKAAGGIQKHVTALEGPKGWDGKAEDVGQWIRDSDAVRPWRSFGNEAERFDKAVDSGYTAMKKGAADADAAVSSGNASPFDFGKFVADFKASVLASKMQHATLRPDAEALATELDDYLANFGRHPTFDQLWEIRKGWDKALRGSTGSGNPRSSIYKDYLNQARQGMNKGLEPAVDAAAGNDLWSGGNRDVAMGLAAKDMAEAGANRITGNRAVGPTEWLSTLIGMASGSGHGTVGATTGGLAMGGLGALERRYGAQTGARLTDRLVSRLTASPAGAQVPQVGAAGVAASRAAEPAPGMPLGLQPAAAGSPATPGSTAPAPQGSATPSAPGDATPPGGDAPPKQDAPHLDPTQHLTRALQTNPNALGPWAPAIAARMRVGGAKALGQFHFLTSQSDPAYREMIRRVSGEDER